MKKHAKLAEKFYNKIIKLHHEEFNYKSITYSKWLDLLASKLHIGDKILDLGCGNGRAVKYVIDKGFKGIGIDVSAKMLNLARKYVPKGKFYKKEFTEIGFKPKSIDAVMSFFALNHIPKTEFVKTMKICKKILTNDGLLLLGMVESKDKGGLFSGFYDKDMQLYGKGYTKKEISDILRKIGFKIIKIDVRHFKGKHFEEDDIFILAKLN